MSDTNNSTMVTLVTPGVNSNSALDVGFFNENTESHAVNAQDEGWYGFTHYMKNHRMLFMTSEDIATAQDK